MMPTLEVHREVVASVPCRHCLYPDSANKIISLLFGPNQGSYFRSLERLGHRYRKDLGTINTQLLLLLLHTSKAQQNSTFITHHFPDYKPACTQEHQYRLKTYRFSLIWWLVTVQSVCTHTSIHFHSISEFN